MLSFTSVGQSQADAANNIQTMRLRDDPPPITHPQRPSKKRKSPPNPTDDQQQQAQQQQQQQQQQAQQVQQLQHVLPPPHALMHNIPGALPPGYPYAPADYTPGGIPAGAVQLQQPPPSQSPPPSGSQRALSSTKRAEQNRKAQRAFRERRDQHVKALESRSQLLDAALASADEANRRWEECRALVDQLRVENAALRTALGQAHLLPPTLQQQQQQQQQAQQQQAQQQQQQQQQAQQQQEDPKSADPAEKTDGSDNPADHS